LLRALQDFRGAAARYPWSLELRLASLSGSGASLTGYGGGLERKRWLLQHEQFISPMTHEDMDGTRSKCRITMRI
jgi:hypothetical protein